MSPDSTNNPLVRILEVVARTSDDVELQQQLDGNSRRLLGELIDLSGRIKSAQGEKLPPVDFQVDRFLEALKDTQREDLAATVDSQGPPQSSPKAAQPVPSNLGEYALGERLGLGGNGTVYQAEHTRLRRTVAIKVLNRLGDDRAAARFDREMHAIGSLSHTNVITASDAREIDGVHFLVMEHVDGKDLSTLVRRGGPVSVADGCEIIRQAASGLDYIARAGLVHRDLKPSNLMLSRQGEIKILDLGLALLDDEHFSVESLTQAGVIMGTIDYMAPEQAEDTHAVDIRADLYSLGATLYTFLTGVPPYSGAECDSPLKKIAAMAVGKPPPIASRRSDVPDDVVKLIEKLMATNPKDRFQTPQDLLIAIAPHCTGSNLAELFTDDRPSIRLQNPEVNSEAAEPSKAHSVSRIARRSKALAIAAAIALLAILVVIAMIYLLS